MREVFIVDAVRSPMGRSKGGMFREKRAENISAELVRHLLQRQAKVDPKEIDDVIWGCVQQTKEQAFNVARFIALQAGVPLSVPAQTVNRLCASSMTALHHAVMAIRADEGELFLVGGVEHMGHVPMDHGLDPNPEGSKYFAKASGMMGLTAELLARQQQISREDQDKFALASHKNAAQAQERGDFATEMVPLWGHDAKGAAKFCDYDEVVRTDSSIEALAKLRPVFDPKGGSITAGNSSAISDGASCMLVCSKDKVEQLGLKPLGKVLSIASAGVEPAIMGMGPVPAVKKVTKKAKVKLEDIGLIELNEAFAAQSLAVLRNLGLDNFEDRVNVSGGAIALGHPLGCSGSRIVTTLLHNMQRRGQSLGLATMCVGFGQGAATVLEAV